VTSTPKKGSTFSFSLETAPEHQAEKIKKTEN
jgi:hypothetical protein